MMNPASRELLGNDRSTSETGPRSDEAMDGVYLYRGIVVGWVSLPQNRHHPPAGQVLDLPSGRVADGGVTPRSDSMMVGATVWHTCINKHRTRFLE